MKFTNACRIVAATTLLATVTTTARSESAWDIEYLPSGDYESAFGAGVYQAKQEGVGFYGNLQITLTEREPEYDSLTISSFGDPVTNRYKDIMIFNFGITKQVASNVSGYAGIGYASATGIAQKDDPMNILASDGKYYVDDPANDESGGNLNAGILFGTEKIVFNLGYHSFTSSAYFGIGGRF
jgi:hypothetical protein